MTLAHTCSLGKGFGPGGPVLHVSGVAFVLGGLLCAWANAYCLELLKLSLNLPTCSMHCL